MSMSQCIKMWLFSAMERHPEVFQALCQIPAKLQQKLHAVAQAWLSLKVDIIAKACQPCWQRIHSDFRACFRAQTMPFTLAIDKGVRDVPGQRQCKYCSNRYKRRKAWTAGLTLSVEHRISIAVLAVVFFKNPDLAVLPHIACTGQRLHRARISATAT